MKNLLLLAFLPLLFINCSSDDDITSTQNPNPSPNPTPSEEVSIVGTWKSVDFGVIVEGTNLSREVKEKIIAKMDPVEQKYIIFNSNGTGMYKDSDDDNSEDDTYPFIYSIKENVLTIMDNEDPDEDPEIYTFEISKNQLILNNSDLKTYQDNYPEYGLTRADYVDTYEKL